jgi:hypothetical protein
MPKEGLIGEKLFSMYKMIDYEEKTEYTDYNRLFKDELEWSC